VLLRLYERDADGLSSPSPTGSPVVIELIIVAIASHLAAASGYPWSRNISTSRRTYSGTPAPPRATRDSAIACASLSGGKIAVAPAKEVFCVASLEVMGERSVGLRKHG
jgi:hypothetical protein